MFAHRIKVFFIIRVWRWGTKLALTLPGGEHDVASISCSQGKNAGNLQRKYVSGANQGQSTHTEEMAKAHNRGSDYVSEALKDSQWRLRMHMY